MIFIKKTFNIYKVKIYPIQVSFTVKIGTILKIHLDRRSGKNFKRKRIIGIYCVDTEDSVVIYLRIINIKFFTTSNTPFNSSIVCILLMIELYI